jgi:hypothetical protein
MRGELGFIRSSVSPKIGACVANHMLPVFKIHFKLKMAIISKQKIEAYVLTLCVLMK